MRCRTGCAFFPAFRAVNVATEESLEQIAKHIAKETGGFTGGPVEAFGMVGQHALESLKQNGLRPDHRVLDVGCGALRLGYWLIRYLDPDRYFGLDPFRSYVDAGLKYAIGPELEAEKRPRFTFNGDFDFSPFGVKFDFVVARSIFSHASPRLIGLALDSFRDNAAEDGIMLASYRLGVKEDETVETTESEDWGWRLYSAAYLSKLVTERGLFADNFGKRFNGQVWLRVSRKPLAGS